MSRRFRGSVSQFVSCSKVEQKAVGIAHQPLRFLRGLSQPAVEAKKCKRYTKEVKDGGKAPSFSRL